jgi:hypothetical protein
MQIDLRYQSRKIEAVSPCVQLGIRLEHQALGFVVVHALVESAVQAACSVSFAPCQTLLQRPPGRQLSPRQARSGQRLVKNQAIPDSARDTAQANFSVAVGPPLPLVISGPACCGSGDVGTAFLYDLIASGGVQPYTWSVTGTLPPGVKFSLSPTPNFSGTPTATGTFPLTIEVTDSTGTHASQSGSIVISPAGTPPPPAPLQIVAPGAGTPDDVGTVGESFDETLEASGGVTPYSWAITGLPPGLSITPGPSEESEISGTPTTAGTYSFTITVTDSTGTRASEASGIIIQS